MRRVCDKGLVTTKSSPVAAAVKTPVAGLASPPSSPPPLLSVQYCGQALHASNPPVCLLEQ
jgi:hypothetical protein